jgi:hypothetical protein
MGKKGEMRSKTASRTANGEERPVSNEIGFADFGMRAVLTASSVVGFADLEE